jgi:lipopolysaccharide export system protein LptA
MIAKRLILFLIALATLTTSLSAQSVVDLIRSDRVNTQQSNQGLIRKLTGNVALRTNNIQIEADSAWHFIDLAEVTAYGNLIITTETEKIYADSLRYDIDQEISTLSGNVIITNATTAIYSQSALYSFLTEIALFNEPIWLQDTSGVMQAQSGVYFNQNDSVAFFGNVQLADTTQYIEADSLFSSRKSKTYSLFGNVFIHSEEDLTDIAGDYVYADSTGKRIISGNSRLMRINEDASDTTWLSADYIEVNRIDSLNTIDAFGRVESVQKDNSAKSDTLFYREQTGIFNLISNPAVWYKNIQLTGDLIDVYTENDSLKSLWAIHSTFVVQEDSVTQRLHQMSGDSLRVLFDSGNVERIENYGASEVLLHYTDDMDQPDGALTFTSQGLIMYFEEGEVADVTALIDIGGQTLPEEPGLESMRLDGFRWNPELRPKRWEDLLLPRLDPISLTPPFSRPNFTPN